MGYIFFNNSSTIIKQYYDSFTKLHCHILLINSAKVTKVEEIPNTKYQLLNIMQMKVVVFLQISIVVYTSKTLFKDEYVSVILMIN